MLEHHRGWRLAGGARLFAATPKSLPAMVTPPTEAALTSNPGAETSSGGLASGSPQARQE